MMGRIRPPTREITLLGKLEVGSSLRRVDLQSARMRYALLIALTVSTLLSAQTSPLSNDARAQFHGLYSQPEEAFRLIGNIYYVGAKNIASYLVVTPQGNILIDTGTTEMTPVI